MDYLVYAYLQLGRDEEARCRRRARPDATRLERFAGPCAVAASQARYVFERGDSKAAAALQPKQTKYAYADAITYYARAVGAARSGDPAAAQGDVAKLAELRDTLKEAKDAYWSNIVDIQRQVASAWGPLRRRQARRRARGDECRRGGGRQDRQASGDTGPLAPARELYGAMLLESGMAKEALAACEAVLKKEPNRLAAYIGMSKSAKAAGDQAKTGECARRSRGSRRMPTYRDRS